MRSVVAVALALLAAAACVAAPRDLEVSFRHDDVTLAGTLSFPGGGERRWPAAVFVSGDGPQGRDNHPAGLFRVLADSLVAHGIAVLWHDDRGAGQSTRPTGPPSYRALVGDTRSAIAFLRQRGDIDPRRVFLVGHSEGAKTSEVLAAEDAKIAGIALLAGATAVNVDTLLEEQARLSPDGFAPRLLPTLERARAGERSRDAADLTDWMREHLEVAPRAVLPKIRCPVLILQGDADRQVSTHHAAEAAALIKGGGNRSVEVRILPGLSHAFNRSSPGVAPSPEVARTDPIVGSVLAAWTARVAGTQAGRR